MLVKKDSRSDDKGPEPESITVGEIDGKVYAFVGLERQSAIMIYDISNPSKPVLENVINTYDNTTGTSVDIAPEGVLFLSSQENHTGENLLVISNEGSGSTTIYSIDKIGTGNAEINNNTSIDNFIINNPFENTLNISYSEKFKVIAYNLLGDIIYENKKCEMKHSINTSNWSKGVYFLDLFNSNNQQVGSRKVIK